MSPTPAPTAPTQAQPNYDDEFGPPADSATPAPPDPSEPNQYDAEFGSAIDTLKQPDKKPDFFSTATEDVGKALDSVIKFPIRETVHLADPTHDIKTHTGEVFAKGTP